MTINIYWNGNLRELSHQELFDLAARGEIGPETTIIVDGVQRRAAEMEGIYFGVSTFQPPPAPPAFPPPYGQGSSGYNPAMYPAPDMSPYYGTPTALPHSKIGIASFVVSLLAGLMIFLLICVAGYLAATASDQFTEKSPQAVLVGLGLFGGFGLELLAILLGIVSLFMPRCNKLFAFLGIFCAVLVLSGTIGLMILGLMAS